MLVASRAPIGLKRDGSTFVVPNSDLISKPVVNKTRFGVLGQVQFLLRIAYGEDPNRARAAVLDEIGRYDKVLKTPGPSVFVDDVDDRGYVFNIVASVGLREEHIALGSPIASVASDEGAESCSIFFGVATIPYASSITKWENGCIPH